MTCTTPLSAVRSAAVTCAWFTNTLPALVKVSFKVFVVLTGCTTWPFTIAAAFTVVPKTWYVKISLRLGKAKSPAMSKLSAVAKLVMAWSSGAKTVKLALGF